MSIRHKLIIPAVNLIIGTCGFYYSMFQISLLQIAKTFDLSNYMMGILVAVQFAGICAPPLFLGTLSERIGKRGVVIISMPLMILGSFMVSATGSLAFLIIGTFIYSSGFSVTEATLTATLGAEFKERSTLLLGISQAIFSIGAVISPFVCKALFAAGYKYNVLFGVVSALLLILFVLFLCSRQNNDIKGTDKSGIGAAVRLLKKRSFLLLAAAMMMYVGLEEMISYFTDSYFQITLGLQSISALALSLFWAGMIPSRLLLGAIKLKHKTLVTFCSAGILVCIAFILLLGNSDKIYAFCVLGVICGPLWPLIMDIAVKKFPENAGTASNIMMSVGGLGGLIMPIAVGALFTGNNFAPAFLAAGFCTLVMAFSFGFSLKKAPDKNT